MKNKITYILIVVSLGISACATTRSTNFGSFFEEDLAYNKNNVRQGNLSQAIGDLSMLLEMDPKNSEARFLRGVAYQELGQYSKAIDDYEVIIKNDQSHSKACYNLAMIYAFKTHNYTEALKYFDKFIALDPKSDKIYSAAKVMKAIDKKGESTGEIKGIIEETITERSLLRVQNTSELENKKKILKSIIEATPSSAEAHFALGQVMEAEGNAELAIKYYKKALEIYPTYAGCHNELGRVLQKNGNEREAEIHLLKASLFEPNTLQ